MMKNNHKIIKNGLYIWFGLIFAIIVIWLIIVLFRIGKVEVTIKCAPYSSVVFIDGKKVNNNGSMYLEEGEHKVFVFLDGFKVFEDVVEINENNKNIYTELIPINSLGKDIAEKTVNDYYDVEKFAGRVLSEKNYSEKDKKLLSMLPFTMDSYGIGVEEDGNNELSVKISLNDFGLINIAVNKLLSLVKENNVNISEYNFIINDYENSLTSFKNNDEIDPNSFIINGFNGLVSVVDGGYLGDYYYAIIAEPSKNGVLVYNRVIVKRTDNSFWELASAPYPILTVYNTEGIPQEVLDSVNNKSVSIENNS